MIKVSDYIASRLAFHGVRHVFMITGGGAMHLNDSIGRNPSLECVFHHHEQACAIAAEGYSRVTGGLAVVNVTTGPGGLNTLTGVMGQWTDSVPVLYVSGQVKFETTIQSHPSLKLRQLGDQEVDIISVVKPLTKFACSVRNPREIGKAIDRAIAIALSGRPGPVWVDVPMDVQGALVDESELEMYDQEDMEGSGDEIVSLLSKASELILRAERPVIVAGHGIRIAKAISEFFDLLSVMKVPVLSTFNGYDIIASDHPLFAGRIGTIGTRSGNFALQNSDLIISIGSRNNIRQVSYNWEFFGRLAKKIVVDIDPDELAKRTVVPDIPICGDAREFISGLLSDFKGKKLPDWSRWIDWCIARRDRYPVTAEKQVQTDRVNPYLFIDALTRTMEEGDIAVAGNGTACVAFFQAGMVKKGQRVFWNSGCASMGYDLPAAIGACIGSNNRKTICIAGDGSLQMNIQELQTVAHRGLPIKIFVLNNGGYISIKQTQKNFFGLPYIGCDDSSGVSFPDLSKIAGAYGIGYMRIDSHDRIEKNIQSVLGDDGPCLCEVLLERDYIFSPKLSSEKKPDGRIISKPLEDMYPFLDRKEFAENMIVPPVSEE